MEARYDEILALAEEEYAESPPTKYYRDGYNLFRRMRDYREHHLLFLRDPRVEPDNSLCERKARLFKRRQHAAIASERRSQIGSGDRSERIRTYNFPQNRVTDHRLAGDVKNFNLQPIMNGDLDALIDSLVTADQAALLQAQTEA